MKESRARESFENGSEVSSVIKNALPAMVALIMVLVYNLADT